MNTELADHISQKEIDLDYFANLVLKEKQIREDLVELTLNHPHIMVYYRGYEILDKAAEKKPNLFYHHFDDFAKLLKHKNTYHREIAIVLLPHLSAVDTENKFSKIIDDYLACLYDKKILIGVYCARYINAIVKNKPQYLGRTADELLAHRNKTSYTEKQEALLEYDTLSLFADNFDTLANKDEVIAFIKSAQTSISPKTKKKSREVSKKLKIM